MVRPRSGRARQMLVLAIVAGIALAAFSGSSADGATAFGKPVRVTPVGCPGALVVWTAGVARGFAQCSETIDSDEHLSYVQGDGTKLFLRRTAKNDTVSQLLDVADDGGATYLLYVGGTKSTPQVRLLTRSHGGTVTDKLLKSTYADSGSIVATKGKWWAVWAVPDDAIAGDVMWQAHTLGTTTSAHRTLLNDPGPVYDPDLTLLTSTTVGMAWGSGHPFECPTLMWGSSSGARKWTRNSSLKSCGRNPSVSHVGGKWRVAYLQRKSDARYHVVLAERSTSGTWVKHSFTRLQSKLDWGQPAVSLAVLGSTVAVGWTTQDNNSHSRGVIDIRRAGHWTDNLLDAGTMSGTVLETLGSAVGLSGTNGAHAQILLSNDDGIDGYDVVRRQ